MITSVILCSVGYYNSLKRIGKQLQPYFCMDVSTYPSLRVQTGWGNICQSVLEVAETHFVQKMVIQWNLSVTTTL